MKSEVVVSTVETYLPDLIYNKSGISWDLAIKLTYKVYETLSSKQAIINKKTHTSGQALGLSAQYINLLKTRLESSRIENLMTPTNVHEMWQMATPRTLFELAELDAHSASLDFYNLELLLEWARTHIDATPPHRFHAIEVMSHLGYLRNLQGCPKSKKSYRFNEWNGCTRHAQSIVRVGSRNKARQQAEEILQVCTDIPDMTAWDDVSQALICKGIYGPVTVIEYCGIHVGFELGRYRTSFPTELFFEAPEGLSIWEGETVFVAGDLALDVSIMEAPTLSQYTFSNTTTRLSGKYRPLTPEEWSSLAQEQPLFG